MATMTTREFLGITQSGERRWDLPIRTQILGGRSGSLFGGAGLAAGVIALEEASNRPVVWATCQFLATVAPPASVGLGVELARPDPQQLPAERPGRARRSGAGGPHRRE